MQTYTRVGLSIRFIWSDTNLSSEYSIPQPFINNWIFLLTGGVFEFLLSGSWPNITLSPPTVLLWDSWQFFPPTHPQLTTRPLFVVDIKRCYPCSLFLIRGEKTKVKRDIKSLPFIRGVKKSPLRTIGIEL